MDGHTERQTFEILLQLGEHRYLIRGYEVNDADISREYWMHIILLLVLFQCRNAAFLVALLK
jgi:hypothetical protein